MKAARLLGQKDGGSAVEFAIILPLFMLVVFGIVEWSLYLFNSHIITDASRSGARHGIVQASPRVSEGDIRRVVLDLSEKSLVTFGVRNQPQVEIPQICSQFGDDLSVKVSYNYTFLLLPALTAGTFSPSKTILAETSMKCE